MMTKQLKTVLSVLPRIGRIVLNKDYTEEVRLFDVFVHHEIKSRGMEETIKLLKSLYLFSKGYTLELKRQWEWKFRKRDASGFPHCIRFLKPLLDGKKGDRAFALSVLLSYKCLPSPLEVSIKSIIEPYNGKDPSPVVKELKAFMKSSDFSKLIRKAIGSRTEEEPSLYMTTKAGANGPLAMVSSVLDAHHIGQIKWTSTLRRFHEVFYENSRDFAQLLRLSATQPAASSKDLVLGRIHRINEGGGKTRTIAIGDYWSQYTLKGFHDKIMNTLRAIDVDATFNHKASDDFIITYLREGICPTSYDLTNATDRFPIWFQIEVLTHYFGEELARSWAAVIAERKFWDNDLKMEVKWECGQPLGLLSSWAVFSLSHHHLIQLAAHRARTKGSIGYCHYPLEFESYVMLGDDLVIFDRRVALEYEELCSYMDIPISTQKSIFPEECSTPVCEFAKRLFIQGDEITPLTPSVLYNSTKSFAGFMELYENLQSKHFGGPIDPPGCRYKTSKIKPLLKEFGYHGLFYLGILSSELNDRAPISGVTRIVQARQYDLFIETMQEHVRKHVSRRFEQLKGYMVREFHTLLELLGLPGDSKQFDIPILIRAFMVMKGRAGSLLETGVNKEFSVSRLLDIYREISMLPDPSMETFTSNQQKARAAYLDCLVKTWRSLHRQPIYKDLFFRG